MAQIRHPLFVSITGKIDNMVFTGETAKCFSGGCRSEKNGTFGIAAESPSAVYRCDRFLPGAKIHISVAGVEGRCREYADE